MTDGRDAAHRGWLRDELPGLVDAKVIDDAAAKRLRAHYRLDALEASSAAFLVFAVMGAGLIGAGILLLVANNWDALSRHARAGLCFALLASAQAIGVYTLARRPESDAFREASAAFLIASFGTALALVSQTYHVQGELGDFVLGWVALMVPAVYVLDARIGAAALALLCLFLPLGRDHAVDRGYVFLFVLGALGPFVARAGIERPGERRTALVERACAFALVVGTSLLVGRDASAVLAVWGVSVLVAVHAALVVRAARELAAFAIGAILLALTYEGAWEELYRELDAFDRGAALWTCAAGLAAALALGRLVTRTPAQRLEDAPIALALLPAWVGFGLGFVDAPPRLAAGILNVSVLGLGLARLVSGLRALDRRRSNFGLALLSVLFGLRFLDSNLSFVVRGLGMVSIGVAFLAVNVYLGRKGGGASR